MFTTDERWKGFEQEIKEALRDQVRRRAVRRRRSEHRDLDRECAARSLPEPDGHLRRPTRRTGKAPRSPSRTAGKAGKIKIVAFDAEPDEVTALKRGLIQALIVQKAYDMGVKAVQDAVAYLKSGKKPPALTTPT